MDLKKIAKAPSVLVILGGLALLPSFYAWFNLDATWDPYGNTKNIKIAVCGCMMQRDESRNYVIEKLLI